MHFASLPAVLAAVAAILSLTAAIPTQNINSILRGYEPNPCPINNVCFAIDQSGSVRNFYHKEQEFVVKIAEEIAKRSEYYTEYSAYGFSPNSRLIQKSTTDLEGDFIPAVQEPVSPAKSTNMYAGLKACFNEIKSAEGNRLIVLVTDGKDNGSPLAEVIAPVIKKAGLSIVTVGIGRRVDETYLKGLASGPEYFVKSSSFSTLLSKVVDVVEDSCDVVTADSCAKAYDSCDFKFAGSNSVPTFSVTGKQDTAFTSKIVSRKANKNIGVLNSNNIVPEFIMMDGTAEKITEAMASPNFTPTHFKPFYIENQMGSGIGHQTYHGNQESVARGRCIRVYFSSYQLLKGTPPYVKKNIHVGKSANKCVVFKSA